MGVRIPAKFLNNITQTYVLKKNTVILKVVEFRDINTYSSVAIFYQNIYGMPF